MVSANHWVSSKLAACELGIGTAPLGGMYHAVSQRDAVAALETAGALGVRYFDTAPMYGLGRSERLTGDAVRDASGGADDSIIVSTKVGRLLRNPRPGAPLPPLPPANPYDSGWRSALPFTEIFDYSYDGVMRSYEDSQQRLGLAAIDILYVHDIGRVTHGERHAHHWRDLTQGGGFKALSALRDEGYIKAIGLGVNEAEIVRDAMEEADLDVCLLAGRYTLLDQSATDYLLPLCKSRNVALVAAGVFNSGVLVSNDAKYDYLDAPQAILERVQALRAVCDRFGVPLPAAAIQFPFAHPGIATVLVGVRSAEEVKRAVDWRRHAIPAAFWIALREGGLIGEGAVLPA